jgi:glycosyltransferase involved in cell wall biosynthesis
LRHIHYISPSLLPSKSANSVHVVLQCGALAKAGCKVSLYAKRNSASKSKVVKQIAQMYGVDLAKRDIDLHSYYTRNNRAVNWHIALLASWNILFNSIKRRAATGYILSRNLYASFILGVIFRMPLMFETHQLEYGIRKLMQKALIKSPRIKTVAISQKLIQCLKKHHQCAVRNYVVLHDATSNDAVRAICCTEKKQPLSRIIPQIESERWESIAGYFGHVYKGRGINVIAQMAEKRPDVLFLIVGGNQNDIRQRKNILKANNIVFIGHISHPEARMLMQQVDVLLMPYQRKVTIGVARHDTAKWMSPMKMFEYMASGVPLIASDLPVLREVLEDGKNALLVPPDQAESWTHALDTLLEDRNLAASISRRAQADVLKKHTWNRRALQIIQAFDLL